MPRQQKSRAHKVSSGSGIKHKKSPQTPIALINMNKGLYVGVAKRWRTPTGS